MRKHDHLKVPWLAASPDGLVTDPRINDIQGLVEIKCPGRAKDVSLMDLATMKSSNFYLKESDGKLHLKKNHDYYYQIKILLVRNIQNHWSLSYVCLQIQGQLHILKRRWCDFVVWTPREDDYSQERIYYDQKFWEEKMLPKLNNFYLTSLLPEVVSPRHPCGQEIRTNFQVVL